MQVDSGDALTPQQQLSDMNLVYRKLVRLRVADAVAGCTRTALAVTVDISR
jgi:hypothetical protein